MSVTSSSQATATILIIGASRGLGHAMAAEFLKRGWNVVGTVRPGAGRTMLHDLADDCPGRLAIEVLDINEPTQITSLRERLSGRTFEMLGGIPPGLLDVDASAWGFPLMPAWPRLGDCPCSKSDSRAGP